MSYLRYKEKWINMMNVRFELILTSSKLDVWGCLLTNTASIVSLYSYSSDFRWLGNVAGEFLVVIPSILRTHCLLECSVYRAKWKADCWCLKSLGCRFKCFNDVIRMSSLFLESSLLLVVVIEVTILTFAFSIDKSVSVGASIGVRVPSILVVAVIAHSLYYQNIKIQRIEEKF